MRRETQPLTIVQRRTLDVRVLPVRGLETSISSILTEQKPLNTNGPFALIDAAVAYMDSTKDRTGHNPKYPTLAHPVDYPTALDREILRRYGTGGAAYEAIVAEVNASSELNGSAPTRPLAVEVIPLEDVRQSDPDPERNLFLAAKEMLLVEAKARYPKLLAKVRLPEPYQERLLYDAGGCETREEMDDREYVINDRRAGMLYEEKVYLGKDAETPKR